jgi:hypothetical protein
VMQTEARFSNSNCRLNQKGSVKNGAKLRLIYGDSLPQRREKNPGV